MIPIRQRPSHHTTHKVISTLTPSKSVPVMPSIQIKQVPEPTVPKHTETRSLATHQLVTCALRDIGFVLRYVPKIWGLIPNPVETAHMILGTARDNTDITQQYGEYNITNTAQDMVAFAIQLLYQRIPYTPPKQFPFNMITPLCQSQIELFTRTHPEAKPHPFERWIFVNGCATNRQISELNGDALSWLFGRPIHVLFTPTSGLLTDLTKSITGRTWHWETASRKKLIHTLKTDINKEATHRIVIIGHSYGTIIVANALTELQQADIPLEKVEFYSFSTCFDTFTQQNETPYIEHFLNTKDLIVNLTFNQAFEPLKSYFGNLSIPGACFVREHYGHFLTEHYLPGLQNGLYNTPASQKPSSTSRLYDAIRPELRSLGG